MAISKTEIKLAFDGLHNHTDLFNSPQGSAFRIWSAGAQYKTTSQQSNGNMNYLYQGLNLRSLKQNDC